MSGVSIRPVSAGIVKICLLGDYAVGKTSLAHRFIEGKFRSDFKSTMGADILKKKLKFDDSDDWVTVNIWDMGGQEAFQVLRKRFFVGAQGAVVIFDVANAKTWESIPRWLRDFRKVSGDKPIMLVGNKIDLERLVARDEVESFLEDHPEIFVYTETSAKTGENVETAFTTLIRKSMENERSRTW
ncbi:MAG: Rab family GTPase [Promethearchaeota archaeon]